jgi:hypothetical protein
MPLDDHGIGSIFSLMWDFAYGGFILGPGRLVLRLFRQDEDDDLLALLIGLVFWAAVGVGIYFAMRS